MPLIETPPVRTYGLESPSGPSNAEAPSLTAAVRALPERFRWLVNASVDPAGLERRPAPDAATAMEHLACVRDLLHSASDRLERLAADSRLVEGGLAHCERIGGYHGWDPEVVLAVLGAEAERMARIAEGLASDERLPVASRRGLALIAAELVDHLVRESEEHFRQAELAMAAPESRMAQGREYRR